MAVNPNGIVPVFDFGSPKIISGYAREAISGGWLVFTSGANDVVSSGADSFATADVQFAKGATGMSFTGVAMHNAASGAPLSVALDGAFIVRCDGSVFASQPIEVNGNDAVQTLGSTVIPSALHTVGMVGAKVGRAITNGTSGNFALVAFGL